MMTVYTGIIQVQLIYQRKPDTRAYGTSEGIIALKTTLLSS